MAEPFGSPCSAVARSGLAAHQLGRLASLLGRRDEARDWLEEALAAHRAAGAGLLVSRTEQALAELGGPVRRTTAPAAATEGEFRRSGRTWQVRWMESTGTVPDSKGMRDLALLLAAPEREVSVLDLVEVAGGPPSAAAGGHAGERLDKPARAAYRRRLSELEDELAEAEANADTGRTQRWAGSRSSSPRSWPVRWGSAVGRGWRQTRWNGRARPCRCGSVPR